MHNQNLQLICLQEGKINELNSQLSQCKKTLSVQEHELQTQKDKILIGQKN
jgi:hypothetical protein